ncbi:MAG: preprotein translocase subunit YajC [Alphaproteobacteria bacterium]|nr:preprotein translocase subunit YajC [Alphaproteobacteria bacterium]
MNPIAGLMPLILIFAVFYFLLIRPQQKKLKEHQKLVEALRRGDKVVTGGGILGEVTKVEDNIVHIEIAPNTRVRVMKGTIADVVSRTGVAEPTNDKAKKSANSDEPTANDN